MSETLRQKLHRPLHRPLGRRGGCIAGAIGGCVVGLWTGLIYQWPAWITAANVAFQTLAWGVMCAVLSRLNRPHA